MESTIGPGFCPYFVNSSTNSSSLTHAIYARLLPRGSGLQGVRTVLSDLGGGVNGHECGVCDDVKRVDGEE